MENGEKYGLEQTTEDRPLFTCRYYFDLREQKKAEKQIILGKVGHPLEQREIFKITQSQRQNLRMVQ